MERILPYSCDNINEVPNYHLWTIVLREHDQFIIFYKESILNN